MTEEATHRDTLHRIRMRALLVLLLFTAAITVKLWTVQWFVLGGSDLLGFVLDAVFVFVFLAAVDLFFADMRFRALLIADTVISVLLLMVSVYYSYYGLLPGRQSLSMIGQATTVGDSVASLLNPFYLILFMDIPLFVWWVVRSRRRGVDPVTGRRPGVLIVPGLRTPYVYQRRLVYVAGLVAATVFASSVQSARIAPRFADNHTAMRERGVMLYVTSALMGPKQQTSVSEAVAGPELMARIDELRAHSAREPLPAFSPGAAAGSHVIVIQVEALQAAAMGARVAGVDITPNLDRLISESWYYPHHFSAVGLGTSADAEYVVNTSLYPPSEAAASIAYADRELISLPRILAQQGYESFTFHTNSAEYWNRTQLYPALGFTDYFDSEFFGTEDTIAFGASDRVLFDKTLQKLVAADAGGVTFYAQVITMSSHFPFTQVPAERRTVPIVEPYKGTIGGDYLSEIRYADAEIGRFIEGLRVSGLLEKSVLVVYGDHFGLPEPRNEREAKAVQELLGHAYTPVDKLSTPLIVRLPGQRVPQQVETPVGMVDLMPTLTDALGIDLAHVPHFGRSVFSAGGGLFSAGGLLPRGAYVDEQVLYVPGRDFESGRVWDVRTREELDISTANKVKYEAVSELLRLSGEYVNQMPVRADYDPDAKRTLPNQ